MKGRTTSASKGSSSLKKRYPNNEDINLANYDPLKQDIEKMRHNNGKT
jgi:hypothetical protein